MALCQLQESKEDVLARNFVPTPARCEPICTLPGKLDPPELCSSISLGPFSTSTIVLGLQLQTILVPDVSDVECQLYGLGDELFLI
jgi:hypothetical protein